MLAWIFVVLLLLVASILGVMLKNARASLEEERAMRAAERTKHDAKLDAMKQEQERTGDRQKRELSQIKERAHLPLAQDLFEGLDTLDMALQNAHDHPNLSREDLLSGISMARASLHKALARHDITPIAPDASQTPFDPRYHEAISVLEDRDLPPDTVASVLRKGWNHTSKVLRPAMVQTSKLPAVAAAPPEDEPVELDFASASHAGEGGEDQGAVAAAHQQAATSSKS